MTGEPDDEVLRASNAAVSAVRKEAGMLLTPEQAVQLTKVALVAAEPWLRLLALRQAAEGFREIDNPVTTAIADSWLKLVERQRKELEES